MFFAKNNFLKVLGIVSVLSLSLTTTTAPSVFAAEGGVCSGYTLHNTCGGQKTADGLECTCAVGYRCLAPSLSCYCQKDDTCGVATDVCDAAHEGQCGVAGGCGKTTTVCKKTVAAVSGGSPVYNYDCVYDYSSPCACVLGQTCPDDGIHQCLPTGGCWAPTPTSTGDYTSGEWVYNEPEYKGPIITDIAGLLAPVFKILFYAGIFIGILGIIYSGYLLIASEGDPGRAKEGKDQFTAAILGTLFVLLSVLILRVIINNILGVTNSGL